jgi:hypothetical protein
VKEIVRGYKDLLFTQYSAFLVISLIHPTLSSLIFDANDPSHRNIRNSIFALSIISHTQPVSTEELKQHRRVLRRPKRISNDYMRGTLTRWTIYSISGSKR